MDTNQNARSAEESNNDSTQDQQISQNQTSKQNQDISEDEWIEVPHQPKEEQVHTVLSGESQLNKNQNEEKKEPFVNIDQVHNTQHQNIGEGENENVEINPQNVLVQQLAGEQGGENEEEDGQNINNNQHGDEQDDDQDNTNHNPAQLYTRMISSMNNEPFLNEETLDGIYKLLNLDSNEMFDEIDGNSENQKQNIEQILKKRLEIYSKKVEVITNIYQDNIPSNSMRNIEKIMSIIKSKEKEIYIYKIEKPIACCHHNHKQQQQQQQQPQENTEPKQNKEQQSRDQQQSHINKEQEQIDLKRELDNDNILSSDIQYVQNKQQTESIEESKPIELNQRNQLNQHQQYVSTQDNVVEAVIGENLENQSQSDQNINEKSEQAVQGENTVEEREDEDIEKLKEKLNENEEIRLRQEEQKRQLVEENQRLKQEYEYIVERNSKLKKDYEEQVQIENYLLRKEAAAQLQQLSLKYQHHNVTDQTTQQNESNVYGINDNNSNIFNINNNQIDESLDKRELNRQRDQSENEIVSQREQCHEHEENEEDNTEIQQQQLGQNFSISDIHSIMQMQFVDLQKLKKLNPVENSITFDMNDNYLIKIKSCDQIKYDTSSLCSRIPHFIFKDRIFPFLSSVELFRVRGVSPEWREMVREVWHKTFKRDMQEQLLATDLCKEIEAQFKLIHIRNPFYQKLNMLIRAMVEVISWEDFEVKCFEDQLNYTQKKVVVAVLRILGYNYFDLENINQFQENDFNTSRVDISQHLRDFFYKSINQNGMSSQELKYVYENFLSQADISVQMFRNDSDKNYILFILIAKQYFLYSLLRNHINHSQMYMQFAKNKLDSLSKDWPTSKGFLEGAYKILLLRNVSVKNGQIVHNSDDENEKKDLLKKKKKSKRPKKNKGPTDSKIEEQSQKHPVSEDVEDQMIKQVHERVQEQQQQNSSIGQNKNEMIDTEVGKEGCVEQKDELLVKQQVDKVNPIEDTTDQVNEEQTINDNQNETLQIQGSQQEEDTHKGGNIISENNQQRSEGSDADDEEEDDDGEEEEEEDEEEEVQSQTELSQLMKSIFNFQKTETQEPDIIIRRKTGLMKIFLDQGTKLDIILNTVISVGMQKMQKDVQQEATDLLTGTKQTLQNLEMRFVENQQQIDEMKEKSQQLEQCLLEKQAELENVSQQNRRLNEEFQQNIQEIHQQYNSPSIPQQTQQEEGTQDNNQESDIIPDQQNTDSTEQEQSHS